MSERGIDVWRMPDDPAPGARGQFKHAGGLTVVLSGDACEFFRLDLIEAGAVQVTDPSEAADIIEHGDGDIYLDDWSI